MNNEKIPCVNGFIYLGLPIGSNGFIDFYIEEGFKKMQRSVYLLYSLGFKPSQSTFRYCLDNLKIPCKKIHTKYLAKKCDRIE
jgi:hypothetical protein